MPPRAPAAAPAVGALLLGYFAGCCGEVLRRRCDGDTPFKEALDLCQGRPLEQIECESVGCCVFDREAGECSYRVASALEETKDPPVDKLADAKPPAQRLIRREELASSAARAKSPSTTTYSSLVESEAKSPSTTTFNSFVESEAKSPSTTTYSSLVEGERGRARTTESPMQRLHEESMAEYKAEQIKSRANGKKANVHPALEPSQVKLEGWDGSVPTPWADGEAPRPGADEPAAGMAQVGASCQSCWTCAKPDTQYNGRGYTCQCLSASMWQRVSVDPGSPKFTQVNEWCNGALPGNSACTHNHRDARCQEFGPSTCTCDAEYRIEAWWSKTSGV